MWFNKEWGRQNWSIVLTTEDERCASNHGRCDRPRMKDHDVDKHHVQTNCWYIRADINRGLNEIVRKYDRHPQSSGHENIHGFMLAGLHSEQKEEQSYSSDAANDCVNQTNGPSC